MGHIHRVHLRNDECFYLRFLLVNVPGPTSFRFLRNVDGELCATYREACQRLRLLEDDVHWDHSLADACLFRIKFDYYLHHNFNVLSIEPI